jgi:hypothetical protein
MKVSQIFLMILEVVTVTFSVFTMFILIIGFGGSPVVHTSFCTSYYGACAPVASALTWFILTAILLSIFFLVSLLTTRSTNIKDGSIWIA